ncbi:hypothetical protein V500_09853 [Pseudogymnoascus sp. VKM F-4518 (FW-2643)]|nr:hypothetical protein V500_09853 [Pseudogymnoascus sp. VKM F-4518 (FW-2643)]
MKSFTALLSYASLLTLASRVSAAPTPANQALEVRQNTGVDSSSNKNTVNPTTPIYPKKAAGDAPYSVDENTLRSAIYIPSTFQYGKTGKQPVLMVPGTSLPGGTTYSNAFGKLLAASTYADPVWLNIPGYSLGDAQVNGEYVAYAMNYLSAVSNQKNISVVSWSQGGINTQWGLKYWPSTRSIVTDFVALAPDFRGTVEADLVCSGLTIALCTPSIKQQRDKSNFIATLRSNGGDSAYVPTTTFYSATDEIVQPEIGTGASSYLLDARNVGVTNNQVQELCPGTVQVVLHEGVLYNAVAWALIEDALNHDGPGNRSRLDLTKLCLALAAPGLNGIQGESILLTAVPNILAYKTHVFNEPAIAAYAK